MTQTPSTPTLAGGAGWNNTTAAAVPNAAGPWHAHLSAIQRPAAATAAAKVPAAADATPAATAAKGRVLLGSSLAPALLGGPVRLRSARKTRLTCRDDSAVYGDDDNVAAAAEQWSVVPVDGEPGEYNIVALGCDKFLSVPPQGPDVDLWHVDDCSGRQRWVFHQVGDDAFAIRVAGGKGDTRVFLGTDDSGDRIKLYSSDDNDKTRWTVRAVDSAPARPASPSRPQPQPQPAAAAGGTRIPAAFVPRLTALTRLSEKDLDVVLQLISLPENGTPKWFEQYNYIEFLGDGRGFTVTLYGACSGTGDLAMIFDELAKISPRSKGCDELLTYLPALRKKRGDDIKGIEPIKKIIKNLGDDAAWRQAVWEVYVKLYWRFAMDWADKKGESAKRPGPPLTLPLTRGFMVDTSINHGANYDSLMDIVKRMPAAAQSSKDELVWFRAFADAREKMLKSGYQDLDTSKTGDRCKLWKDLAANGHTALRVPFKAFKGYWGDYTIA